jgi:hypothetical protein
MCGSCDKGARGKLYSVTEWQQKSTEDVTSQSSLLFTAVALQTIAFVNTKSIYALNLYDYLTTKQRDHRSLYALYIMWSPRTIQVERQEGKRKGFIS